jgi:hypothetical protein
MSRLDSKTDKSTPKRSLWYINVTEAAEKQERVREVRAGLTGFSSDSQTVLVPYILDVTITF